MLTFSRNITVSSPLLKNNDTVVISYDCDDETGKKPLNIVLTFNDDYIEFEDFELFNEFVTWVVVMRSRIQNKHCKKIYSFFGENTDEEPTGHD